MPAALLSISQELWNTCLSLRERRDAHVHRQMAWSAVPGTPTDIRLATSLMAVKFASWLIIYILLGYIRSWYSEQHSYPTQNANETRTKEIQKNDYDHQRQTTGSAHTTSPD
jgi:ABC-type nickel/cobalt efflux system permease component RcnA